MNAAPSVYRGVFPQDISYIKGGEGFTFNDQTAVSRSSFYSQSSKTYNNTKFFFTWYFLCDFAPLPFVFVKLEQNPSQSTNKRHLTINQGRHIFVNNSIECLLLFRRPSTQSSARLSALSTKKKTPQNNKRRNPRH